MGAASPAHLSPRGDGPEVVRGIAKQDLSNLQLEDTGEEQKVTRHQRAQL